MSRSKSLDSGSLAASLVILSLVASVSCFEQDAIMIKPLASLAKSIISTVTVGDPFVMNFSTTDVVYNFPSFVWRTGFPVTMPSGIVAMVQSFYDQIRAQVDAASVKTVERKSLAALKADLDDIVDAIVEQVRQSPDGLYTKYTDTKVNGVPLEEACVKVGIQLKAYGVDLYNYRDIAGMVLGVPLMPTVASTVMNVADNVPSLGSLTGNRLPETITSISGSAFNTLNSVSNNLVRSPLSLFNRAQQQLQQSAPTANNPVDLPQVVA